MLIDRYHQAINDKISFRREQASLFAKKIADDFNPLHDVASKRFCVPGDLLFAVILSKYGVSEHMKFTFSGMVTDEVNLKLPTDSESLSITGDNNKEYLSIERRGANTHDNTLINNLTHSYVSFSGHTFPLVLIPLLQEQGVMLNPDRPMVMYQSMLLELDRLDLSEVKLELNKDATRLNLNGKRGNICLAFNLKVGNDVIGHGEKNMILSGLQPFQQSVVDDVLLKYKQLKDDFFSKNY